MLSQPKTFNGTFIVSRLNRAVSSIAIYFVVFSIFYFFSDYIVNLKSNINKISLKINKKEFILFSGLIVFSLSLLFLSRNILYQYLLKAAWYSTLSDGSKYNASSAFLFAIFTGFLSLFTIYKFYTMF